MSNKRAAIEEGTEFSSGTYAVRLTVTNLTYDEREALSRSLYDLVNGSFPGTEWENDNYDDNGVEDDTNKGDAGNV